MKIQTKPAEVLVGSSRILGSKDNSDRLGYLLENIGSNLAIETLKKQGKTQHQAVAQAREQYLVYRTDWKKQPDRCIRNAWTADGLREQNILPLCIDIEVAAICDLACPFCHRQFLATPDKIIEDKLCFNLIDQAAEMDVPSIKFNLRGEPLMHPRLPLFVRYAKQKGILETGINTNATHLTKKTARELIDAGLDIMIYSFDGGSKETYEKMRPGRFRENRFEDVYENIKGFSRIREEAGAVFPYTKIQMILTEDSKNEIEEFYSLFSPYVDDVSVSPYQERGGKLASLSPLDEEKLRIAVEEGRTESSCPTRLDADSRVFVGVDRIPCEQPFQRLSVTYEGRVGMCCIDWGATHVVGFVNELAFSNNNNYEKVVERVEQKKKGFENLGNVTHKPLDQKDDLAIDTLKDIWYGSEIQAVRQRHYAGEIDATPVCANCTYTDTIRWVPLV